MVFALLAGQVRVQASTYYQVAVSQDDVWAHEMGGVRLTLPNGSERIIKAGQTVTIPATSEQPASLAVFMEAGFLQQPVPVKRHYSAHFAAWVGKPEVQAIAIGSVLFERRRRAVESIKILLVGVPLIHRSFPGANKALPVLASSLHLKGYNNVVQMDLEHPNRSRDDLMAELADTDLVIFAGGMTPQWPEIDELSQAVAAHLQQIGRTNVPLLVGGYAVRNAADILKASPHITAFFDGEGEVGIIEIADAVSAGQFEQRRDIIRGLCHLDADGIYHGSTADRVKDIDPYDQQYGLEHNPTIHNMEIFRTADGRQLQTGQIFSQRGCPFVCSYCNKSQETNGVVWLSNDAFRNQVRKLKAMGIEAVYLDVDTATINRAKFLEHAAILKEEGMIWGSNTRIDKIDYELMQASVDAGCVYMFFGVEHTSPLVSLAIGKFNGSFASQLAQARAYPDRVVQVFNDMEKAGLPSSYFIILGLPTAILDETESKVIGYRPTTINEDLAAIAYGLDRCHPDYLNFNMLRFMPGSAAADIPSHPAFTCIRPSGKQPITAGYFLPRVAEQMGYVLPNNPNTYLLCESVGRNQPTTTAVDSWRIHETVRRSMEMINARIDAGHKPTALFMDRELMAKGLVKRDESGRYWIAPLEAFDNI